MLRQHIVSFQEGSELVADHSLNKFRHVGEVGNWPVVLDIILILLDDWFDLDDLASWTGVSTLMVLGENVLVPHTIWHTAPYCRALPLLER